MSDHSLLRALSSTHAGKKRVSLRRVRAEGPGRSADRLACCRAWFQLNVGVRTALVTRQVALQGTATRNPNAAECQVYGLQL